MSRFWNSSFRTGTALALTLFALAGAQTVQAQLASPWSLDFGAGFMRSRTAGTESAGTGMGLAGQLSWLSKAESANALLVGVNATGFLQIDGGSKCDATFSTGIVSVRYGSNRYSQFGDCTLRFPNGGGLGLLGGLEHRIGITRAAARFAAGPMLFVTSERGGSLGLQSRVDLTFRTFSRTQLVLWSQNGYVPANGRGNAMMFSIGAGFRARDFMKNRPGECKGTQTACWPSAPKIKSAKGKLAKSLTPGRE